MTTIRVALTETDLREILKALTTRYFEFCRKDTQAALDKISADMQSLIGTRLAISTAHGIEEDYVDTKKKSCYDCPGYDCPGVYVGCKNCDCKEEDCVDTKEEPQPICSTGCVYIGGPECSPGNYCVGCKYRCE